MSTRTEFRTSADGTLLCDTFRGPSVVPARLPVCTILWRPSLMPLCLVLLRQLRFYRVGQLATPTHRRELTGSSLVIRVGNSTRVGSDGVACYSPAPEQPRTPLRLVPVPLSSHKLTKLERLVTAGLSLLRKVSRALKGLPDSRSSRKSS